MQIKIHRGTHQIGGTITEIQTATTRIIIDLGSELPDENGNVGSDDLQIDGLTTGMPSCDAVLFTHYHGDHIGKLSEALPGIPLYMGPATKEIYLALQKHVRNGTLQFVETVNCFSQGVKFWINGIAITPLAVDHSAYDAYMFLIEAEGKRILHTGDFRRHGFRGKGLIPTLTHYVGQVDVLIIEGTVLSRSDQAHQTEHELQNEFRQLLRQYKYVFAICSSTNIDRIASLCQATLADKYVVGDRYQKEVLDIVERFAGHHSPLYRFDRVRFYAPNLKDKMEDRGFCMLVRSGNLFQKFMDEYREKHNEETLVIYSLWDGYIKQPDNSFEKLMNGFNHTTHLHTSGHADIQTIIDVCKTVSPRKAIIPIHTTNSKKLSDLGLPYWIEYLDDGQAYDV